MEGAIREAFPGVQMGKMTADGMAFKNTNPNVLEITFTGPVSHGPLFSEMLSKLVKRQLGENNDDKDLYSRIVMEDNQGHNVTAYFDHDGGEQRRCTGQPTKEEKVKEQQKFYAAEDAKELAKVSGAGGGGGGGSGGGGGGIDEAKVKAMMPWTSSATRTRSSWR